MKVLAWRSSNHDFATIEAIAIVFAILEIVLYLVTATNPPMGPVRW